MFYTWNCSLWKQNLVCSKQYTCLLPFIIHVPVCKTVINIPDRRHTWLITWRILYIIIYRISCFRHAFIFINCHQNPLVSKEVLLCNITKHHHVAVTVNVKKNTLTYLSINPIKYIENKDFQHCRWMRYAFKG